MVVNRAVMIVVVITAPAETMLLPVSKGLPPPLFVMSVCELPCDEVVELVVG